MIITNNKTRLDMAHLQMPLRIEFILSYNIQLSSLVIFVRLIVIIFVKVYLDQKIFITILRGFVCRIIILLNSGKSFTIIILGWDLLGLTRLLLVLYYNSLSVNKRAFFIILVNSFSDGKFIIMILIFYSIHKLQLFRYLLLIITLVGITKSAIWPIHYWLPLAIDAPTPVRCLLHRSTLVVAGYYLYKELIYMTNNIALIWVSYISYLISLNYMWCCEDIKKFIAYFTIINISIIMIYARRIYCDISHIHVIRHRLYKSILFLVAGYLLIYNSGNQDIRSISIPISIILVIILIIFGRLSWLF